MTFLCQCEEISFLIIQDFKIMSNFKLPHIVETTKREQSQAVFGFGVSETFQVKNVVHKDIFCRQ